MGVHNSQRGHVGLIVLDRPRSMNALNVPMVEEIGRILRTWASHSHGQSRSPRVVCIMSKGAGEVVPMEQSKKKKQAVFCAGGDVKEIIQRGSKGDTEYGLWYFDKEYHVDYMISQYPMPYVAIMDGITFGGGVGVAIHGTFQIATERTIFAMPECAIGLFPDIGGSYFLSRRDRGVGMYMGLTGARLHGIDVKHAGFATHYIHSSRISDLLRDLSEMGISDNAYEAKRQVGIVLRRYENASLISHPVGLLDAGMRRDIEAAFGSHMSRVEDIFQVVEQRRGTCTFYDSTYELLHRYVRVYYPLGNTMIEVLLYNYRCSPLSLKLTFELIRRGASMPLSECFKMENRLIRRLILNPESDFYTGVRAKLLTREDGLPRWSLPTLAHVETHLVQQFFNSLDPHEELQLSSALVDNSCRL